MRRRLFALSLLLSLVAIPVFADKNDDIKVGAKLYDANCAACHGDEGKGDGPQSRFLQPKPADLTAQKFKHGDGDDDVATTITKGVTGTAMNGFEKVLQPDEVKALVAYIQSLRKPAPTASH